MKTWITKFFFALSFLIVVNSLTAQEVAKNDTAKVVTAVKQTAASNVMLNASSDNGPRNVNIGLPASIGGTTILENGLPVVYHFTGQGPTRLWRAGTSFSKFSVLSVGETAISIGEVGVSVSTYTNKGSDKFKGAGALASNHFGLLRGDLSISGPLGKGFFYSASAFVNMDPGTFKTDFSTYLDRTQIYKFVINKKFKNGEFGIQYKFADSRAIGSKVSPYIYHLDGTVSQFGNFNIGKDSYLERSGKSYVINPLTGNAEVWDQMNDMGSTNHVIDLLGNYKLNDNGLRLDYVLRYNYAESGLYNPYYSGVSKVDPTKNRYFYMDDPTEQYQSEYVQSLLSLTSPKNVINTVMARFDLSKKTNNHHWSIGLNEWYYKVDDFITASSTVMQETTANPRRLLPQTLINGQWVDGVPSRSAASGYNPADIFGNVGHNSALQFYTGYENKLAIFATEKWTVSPMVQIDLGGRLELQTIDGKWYPGESRKAAASNGIKNGVIDRNGLVGIKKNWFNKAFNANIIIKAFPVAGILADLSYTEVAGNLSSYSGADDPNIEPSKIPGASAGVYFNDPLISVVSKATYIQRDNFKNNSTFQNGYKQTITYGIQTLGWTTDMVISPFKGFKLHMLLTLQNPKYTNFTIDLRNTPSEGGLHQLSGGTARSVSKTIVEIDPSYTYKKWRIWASGRYFSKEAANYPNTLWFAGRFETFAGLNYKVMKDLDLSLSVVNLLNQKGAQGSISGTNTTTAEEALTKDNTPLVGTYMRPLTFEFGAKFKF